MLRNLFVFFVLAVSSYAQTLTSLSPGGESAQFRWDDLQSTGRASNVAQVSGAGGKMPTVHTWQVNVQGVPTTCTIKMQTTMESNASAVDSSWFDLTADLDCSSALYHTEAGPELAKFIAPNITALVGTSASTVANATETLAENAFTTHALWATTGDFDDTGGDCTWTFSSGTGTCTQGDGGYANAMVASRPYTFVYDVVSPSGDVACQITQGLTTIVDLDEAAGTGKTVQTVSSATITDDFQLTCTGTSGAITFDNVFWYEQNATNETPIRINTAAAHGLTTGDRVTITGTLGNTNANVTKNLVTVVDSDTFTLDGVAGNAPWLTGGGTATSAPEVTVRYIGGN